MSVFKRVLKLVSAFVLIGVMMAISTIALAETAQPEMTVTKGAGSFKGTVLFAISNPFNPKALPRVVEVDSTGKIVWEYKSPQPAYITDVQKLDNGDVVFVELGTGVKEVNRAGKVIWSWSGAASHHAEVLPNGNVLIVSAMENWVKEVDFDGRTVWEWNAKDQIKPYAADNFEYLADSPGINNMYALYKEAPFGGKEGDWTHVNSAQRLPNGDTLLSLRNLDLVIEVNPKKEVVWTYGSLVIKHQHSPQVLPNGNLLIVDNGNGRIIEVDRKTQQIVWQYKGGLRIPVMAHAQRLEDGHTLITDSQGRRIIMVNMAGEITWELTMPETTLKGIYRAKYYSY